MTELSIRQLVRAWELFCIPAPGYARHSAPGVECIFSNVPIPFFNMAVVTSGDVASAAEAASTWAAQHPVAWLLAVTAPATLPEDLGFVPIMGLTGMLATDVAAPGRLPDGLTLTHVKTDAESQALMDINSAAYGISLDAGNEIWGRSPFWQKHVGVLGSVDGKPASSTGVLDIDGYRYVALVATMPEFQRRGYAEAVMRRALQLAGNDKPTFLHATDAGRPIYARMGYQPVSTHTLFMNRKFMDEQ